MTAATHSIIPMIAEAERVVAAACEYWKLKLTPDQVVVTIQSKGRKNALGWFCAESWQNGGKKPIHEINLSAEYLKRAKDDDGIGETIIHELAHAENKALGIKDCVKNRHNRKFKERAEALGLIVEEPAHPRLGFAHTALGSDARAFLKSCAFKREVFDANRLTFSAAKSDSTRLKKCECPECGYSARITRKWIEVGLPQCPCGAGQLEEKD